MRFSGAIAFSFGKRPKDAFTIKKTNQPSPLDYQDTGFRSTTPNWRIGSTKKELKITNNEDLPGPGKYDLPSKIGEGPTFKIRDSNKSLNAHDSVVLSSSRHNADSLNYNPNYELNSSKIAFTMGKKMEPNYDNKVPGPGTYQRVVKSSSNPAYSVTKSPRKDNFVIPSQSPGPAKYYQDSYPTKNSAKIIKFGSDQKLKPIRSITPGPGNYQQKPKFGHEGKIVSLRGKPVRNDSTDAPGPGAYDPRDPKPSAISYKIMNPSKSVVECKIKDEIPGPGQYTPEKHFVSSSKNIPKWTLGDKVLSSSFHGVLEKIHGSIPAPGNYDLDRSLGEGPKYSMLPKKDLNYDNKIPGPGFYQNTDANLKDSSPAWKFGSSGRLDFLNVSNNFNPAPDQYSPELRKTSSAISFPKDAKNKPIKNEVPGPGQYQIPSALGILQEI